MIKLPDSKLLPGSLLFLSSFLWFYFPGEYVLIANRDLSLFLWSKDYLNTFLDHPGGLLEYLGSFLNQFYRFRFIGTLVLSMMILASYFVSALLMERISGRKDLSLFPILTGILLLGMHNFYPHQIGQSLGLVLAIFLALKLPGSRKHRQVFLALTLPLFYLFAGGFMWIYCGLILASYLGREKGAQISFLLLSTVYPVLLVLCFARFFFLDPLPELAMSSLPFGREYGRALWPSLYLVWILCSVVLLRLPLPRFKPGSIKLMLAQALASVLGLLLVLHLSYNRKNGELFQIEKMALERDWNKLLAYTVDHPSSNLFGVFYTNLALASKGKLCTSLFQYPQSYGRRGLCFNWDAKGEILRRGSDFFWEISFVNEAHHWAYESMIVDGYTCRNLVRLIQTELVRGNNKLAGKYVNLLGKALFHKKLARHYNRLLNDRSALAQDAELGPRLHSRIVQDFFADGMDLEINLRLLLANDPSNLKAWDYLMALLLLEKQVDKIGAILPAYVEASGGHLPTLLDESLLIYRIAHRDEDILRLEVSPPTLRRFDTYTRVLREYRDQNEAARVLHPNYGDSFWFYLNFVSLPNP